MNFLITAANVADNKEQVLKQLLVNLQGKCYGDRGYLTQLFEQFYLQGLHLITHIRSNMKNQLLKMEHQLKLRKRAVIESVNDILVSVFDIEHSRHRNPLNALVHILAGLIAYCFYEDKPAVWLPKKDTILLA